MKNLPQTNNLPEAQSDYVVGPLPITRKEILRLGWDSVDVIIITGDAYVDHPSFGSAVIGRLIESEGFRVAIIPQPNWQDDLRDFKKFGKPKYFFGVTAGNMDSMVNHYTANKRLRSNDAYTPGGESGFRPDYATIVYTKILKELYPETPVIIGGIEASMWRLTHYDYWSDELKPSILIDSGADLLIYGMGESPLIEIMRLLKKNVPITSMKTIPQTSFIQNTDDMVPKNKRWNSITLSSHEKCLDDQKTFASNFKVIEQESNKYSPARLIQQTGDKRIIINPPFNAMTESEIDRSFDLPYTRLPHWKYKKRGTIPAYEMIKHSVTLHRGCFGGCSFCSISMHQGKFISSRSKKSILNEIEKIVEMQDFKGYISDLGGPSANMYRMKGKDFEICKKCSRYSCIYPEICKNLDINHKPLIKIYKEVDKHKKIKKSFVSSGIRYDLFLVEDEALKKENGLEKYLEKLVTNHVSGRLKVAPEHTEERVLKVMRKPSFYLFKELLSKFIKINKATGLKQILVPYLISSHPGCTEEDMYRLTKEMKKLGFKLEQVQDFTPTPMTLATVMYYSGYDPYTMKTIYSAKTKQEKLTQKQYFFRQKK